MSLSAREVGMKAKRVYRELRAKHGELAADLDALNKKLDAVSKSRDLTITAKQQRLTELREKIRMKEDAIAAIQPEARKRFAEIQRESRETFPAFRIDKDAVDRNVLDLVSSGIMTAAEIAELINRENYVNTNFTMCRLLGKRLDAIADEMRGVAYSDEERQRVSAIATQLQSVTSPIEAALSAYSTVAVMALRSDVLLADGIAESMMTETTAQLDADCAAIDGGE